MTVKCICTSAPRNQKDAKCLGEYTETLDLDGVKVLCDETMISRLWGGVSACVLDHCPNHLPDDRSSEWSISPILGDRYPQSASDLFPCTHVGRLAKQLFFANGIVMYK
mmetsp:Transcript_70720/g.118481  ORF Transcript_70720/g.118481 Transcript_70720/m.118481 type:complete len:109 (-) Transcript_70720:178-504(-)